jgi:hypothetical protein
LTSPTNTAAGVVWQNPVFSWESVDNATNYQYQISTNNGFTEIAKSSYTSLTFASSVTLSPTTTYYWRVRAANADGHSPWSSTWSFTTEDITLTAPTLISPENQSSNTADEVMLSWNSVFGATGYRMQFSMDPNFETAVSSYNVSGSSHTLSGLGTGITYYWRVCSTNMFLQETIQSGASYQWIDCDNENTPITGATGQSFTPSMTGNYAAIVQMEDCIVMTDCHYVEVGIVEYFQEDSV